MSRRKIAVAMSGGVDSSVAAYLLKQQYPSDHILALHMNNWNAQDEEDAPAGCLEQDLKDAEAVCQYLSLPLHKASFAAEYWTGVFEPFVEGISQQHYAMPNPDVGCNAIVKFGAMKKYAHKTLGVNKIATGHYARLWNRERALDEAATSSSTASEGMEQIMQHNDWLYTWGDKEDPLLRAGVDKSKDQSYFLAGVQGRNFRNVLFPLGDLHKTAASGGSNENTVRKIAEEAQLPNASKRESMGICFVGKRNFGSFISQYLPSLPPPGNFIDVESGAIVGQPHAGSLYYTIGQGAKISGAAQKWFVVDHVGSNNQDVLVCPGTHHPALYSDEMRINDMVWIGGELPAPLKETGRLRVICRTRHLQPLISCEIRFTDRDQRAYQIHFDQPIRAITPGQTAAFYVGDVCLGGGAIVERGPSHHERGVDLPRNLHPAGHNDLSVVKVDDHQDPAQLHTVSIS